MRTLNLILILLLLASRVSLAQIGEGDLAHAEKTDLSKTITVYPNPTTDFVNIRLTAFNAHQTKITLHNILGNEIQAETEVIDDHEIRVRVKELATGYYLIAVRDDQTHFRGTYKFLKR